MPAESPTRFVMVPARRSNEPTARKRARRVLGALFLAASLSVVAVFFALAKGRTKPDLSTVDPKGRDLAYTAAVNFLSGAYQAVPRADTLKPDDLAKAGPDLLTGQPSAPLQYQSLSWVGFTPEHFGSAQAGFTDFEVHHFLVVLPNSPSSTTPAPTGTTAPRAKVTPPARRPGSKPASPQRGTAPAAGSTPGASAAPSGVPGAAPTGASTTSPNASPSPSPTTTADVVQAPASNVLKLDVPLLITAQGPRLSAAPAFSVWTGGVGSPTGAGDYTNYTSLTTEVSDAAKNQVAEWAKAYVTGDATGLLALTGDQNSHHHYVGLSGFTLPASGEAVQILSAIKAAKGQLVVRARVVLARTPSGGTVSGTNGTTQQFVTFADFDLLVGAPAGAQPPILAWGPAGSAAELEPYSNALNS
ncbi:hypothetical protein NE236_29725 [Actinoallomurus purpureus]|uniref:hypothetical protein n=1 Tax=Actinoallomurus purpureus TaxID=478114 RepID=UPI0020936887|nr:hypothetical protein [Actinoallomurus purpureus]MCO6009157.1 hypothetical protein [Actinoallomurus purpureus]